MDISVDAFRDLEENMKDRFYMNNPRLDILEFLELVQNEHPTDPDRRIKYKAQCDAGLRFGQAFMNALRDTPYYDQLTGTDMDPYYKTTYNSVFDAIEYLFRKN